MPPFLRMNLSSGSEYGLYIAAYLMTRLHLLRVRLSALAGSAVHRMTAANGSQMQGPACSVISRPSAVYHATRAYTAVRYP